MATLTTGPVWGKHSQGGQNFSVRHLHPAFVNYVIPAVPAKKGKPGRAEMTVRVRTSYSHHCFTQALEKMPGADPDHYYNCTKRPNETRVFCVDRWSESTALPAILAGVSTCYFTRHHNYFVIRDPANVALGEYFVYFTVTWNQSGFIDIEVESAYPRLDGEREKNAGKTSLNVLIVNAIRGVKTHRP